MRQTTARDGRDGVSEPVLEARGLTKRLGRRAVLAELDLVLRSGELVALLGENGAGKTTLLRCLAGLAQPGSGAVIASAARDRRRARRAIGYVGHETLLYAALSARENLVFASRLYGRVDAEHIARLLGELGLSRVADRSVDSLSRGMRQRLALARALVHRPAVLLLDEPWSSLDPIAAAHLDERLLRFREAGGTALYATLEVMRSTALSDRALLLRHGRVETLAEAPIRAEILSRALAGGRAV
jgi:heme exporter protein A